MAKCELNVIIRIWKEHHLNSCCNTGFKESECSWGFVLIFTAGELVFYGSCGKRSYLFTLLLLCVLAVTWRGAQALEPEWWVGYANTSWRGGALLSILMSSFALFFLSLNPELFIGNMSIIYSVYMAEYDSNYELLLVPPFSPCRTEMARKVVT